MEDGIIYFQVTDDDMIADQIRAGDTVLIHKQDECAVKDIAAIACESKIILRRVMVIGQNYLLIPSNPTSRPELLENVVIVGKVLKNMIKI